MKETLKPGIRYEHKLILAASKTVPALCRQNARPAGGITRALLGHACLSSLRLSSARRCSRIRYFWTLPLIVSGKLSMKRT